LRDWILESICTGQENEDKVFIIKGVHVAPTYPKCGGSITTEGGMDTPGDYNVQNNIITMKEETF
jgi:hypothetical protein